MMRVCVCVYVCMCVCICVRACVCQVVERAVGEAVEMDVSKIQNKSAYLMGVLKHKVTDLR